MTAPHRLPWICGHVGIAGNEAVVTTVLDALDISTWMFEGIPPSDIATHLCWSVLANLADSQTGMQYKILNYER